MMEEGCYVYLMGDPDEDFFKYGITKSPERRLKEIQSGKYMVYEGFPCETARVCYLSPPLDRTTAREIEILWPCRHIRPFIGDRSHKCIEVVRGDIDDIVSDIQNYIANYDGPSRKHEPFEAWHFFSRGAQTLCYHKRSNDHLLEAAKILEHNPFCAHFYSYTGSHDAIWLLSDDYRGRKGLPKQTYTLYEEHCEALIEHLLSIDTSELESRRRLRHPQYYDKDDQIDFDLDSYDESSPV